MMAEKSMRDYFGEALAEYGAINPNIYWFK